MSASSDKKNGYVTVLHLNDRQVMVNEALFFEECVDQDEALIKVEMGAMKTLKKLSFIKLLTFFIEYPILRVVDKKLAQGKLKEFNLCWRLLRGKVNLEQFKLEHNELSQKAVK